MTQFSFFDPPGLAVSGMRSAVHPSLLGPGEFPLIQNLRWDKGQLEVRPGCASFLNIPTAGATPLQLWSGTLNGTAYLVGAFVVSGKIRLYYKSGGAWSELTESSGWCGDSGFATSSGLCRMALFRTVRGSILGSVAPSTDVLMIQNGEDYPRVWDPSQNTGLGPGISIHRPISVPAQASQFRQVGTLPAFLQCAGAGGKTYAAPSAGPPNRVNEATWLLSDSVAVYTGTQAVPQLACTNAAIVTEVAAMRFTTSATFSGEQLLIAMEGANAPTFMSLMKIEISPDNAVYPGTTWNTVYDPTSTTANLREIVQVAFDPQNFRYIFAFRLAHLTSAQRTCYGIRFTCMAAPGVALTTKILMIAGSGAVEAGSLFGLGYSNAYSRAESLGMLAFSSGTELIKNLGGPNQGSAASLSLPPADDRLLYDYSLYVKNSETATPITGDIGAEPTQADIYLQRPGADEPLFAFSVSIWLASATNPKTWVKYDSNPIIQVSGHVLRVSDVSGFDRNLLDTQRPMPGPYNIAVPAARDLLWANNRLFVFGIKEPSGSYALGDCYYSAERIGFRMQSIVTSEELGGRFVIAGETGRRLIATAAGDQGAAYVYAFTDSNFYSIGGAGAFLGSGFTATTLSRPIRVAPHGTNSPESLVEYRGAIFWVDQDLIVRRYQGGQLRDLSRLQIDDKLKALPTTRRLNLAGCVFKDRYYLAYTPVGGSTNTSIFIFNEVLGAWESTDALPALSAEHMTRFYDSTAVGAGQRLFFTSASDGKTYEYETGTTDPGSANIAWQLTTREITGPDLKLKAGQPFVIDSVTVLTDALSGSWTVDRYYRIPACQYRSSLNTLAGWVSDKGKAHSAISAESDGKGERGSSAYITFGNTSPGGTKILKLVAHIEALANEEAVSV